MVVEGWKKTWEEKTEEATDFVYLIYYVCWFGERLYRVDSLTDLIVLDS